MVNRFQALIVAVLGVAIVAVHCTPLDPIVESYKFIETFIESKSGTVEDWLKSMTTPGATDITPDEIKRQLNGASRETLINSIKTFLAMESVLEPGIKCSKKSYEIIKPNLDAVMAAEPFGVDQVYDIIDEFADDHVFQCYNKYPNKVAAVIATLDVGTQKMLTKITRSITNQIQYKIKTPKFPGTLFEPASAIYSINQVSNALLLSLRRFSAERGIILSKWTPKKSIDEAIETNYVEPCKKLIEATEEVFLPASVDFVQLPRREQILKNRDLFFDTWGSFKVCTFIISNIDEVVARVVKGLR